MSHGQNPIRPTRHGLKRLQLDPEVNEEMLRRLRAAPDRAEITRSTIEEINSLVLRYPSAVRVRFTKHLREHGSGTVHIARFLSPSGDHIVRLILTTTEKPDVYMAWPFLHEVTLADLAEVFRRAFEKATLAQHDRSETTCFICDGEFLPGDMVLDALRGGSLSEDHAHLICVLADLRLRDRFDELLRPLRIFDQENSDVPSESYDVLARDAFATVGIWRIASSERHWRLMRKRASSGWPRLIRHHQTIGSRSPSVFQQPQQEGKKP